MRHQGEIRVWRQNPASKTKVFIVLLQPNRELIERCSLSWYNNCFSIKIQQFYLNLPSEKRRDREAGAGAPSFSRKNLVISARSMYAPVSTARSPQITEMGKKILQLPDSIDLIVLEGLTFEFLLSGASRDQDQQSQQLSEAHTSTSSNQSEDLIRERRGDALSQHILDENLF